MTQPRTGTMVFDANHPAVPQTMTTAIINGACGVKTGSWRFVIEAQYGV